MNYAPRKSLGTVRSDIFRGYFLRPATGHHRLDSYCLLQMGGATGSGFMSYRHSTTEYQRLADSRSIRSGRLHPLDLTAAPSARMATRRLGVREQREVEYPAPRYEEPS